MRDRSSGWMIKVAIAAAVVGGVVAVSITRTSGQAVRSARPARVSGKPNFSGIWQANNEANWDLQAHPALPGAVTQQGVDPHDYARVPAAPVLGLGSVGAVPGSLGVVEGDGQIPYKPEALVIKQHNAEHWIDRDPEVKCLLARSFRARTTCRITFEITQSTNKIHFAYEYTNTARTVDLGKVEPPPDDTWMGFSVGHWEGDTLVVDVSRFNDRSWFDRAGDFHSSALHLVRAVHNDGPGRHLVRCDDRRSERFYADVEDRNADLSSGRAEHATSRFSLQRIRRRVHVPGNLLQASVG